MNEERTYNLLEQRFSRRDFLRLSGAAAGLMLTGVQAPISPKIDSRVGSKMENSEAFYPDKPMLRFTMLTEAQTASLDQSCVVSEVIPPIDRTQVEAFAPLQPSPHGVFLPYAGVSGDACYPNGYGVGIMTGENTSIAPVISFDRLVFHELKTTNQQEIFPQYAEVAYDVLNSLRNEELAGTRELLGAWPWEQNNDENNPNKILTQEGVQERYGLTVEQAERIIPTGIGAENPLAWSSAQDVSLAEAVEKVNRRHIRPEPGQVGRPIELQLAPSAEVYEYPSYSAPRQEVGLLCGFDRYTPVDVGPLPQVTINSDGNVEVFMHLLTNERTDCSLISHYKYLPITRVLASMGDKDIVNEILDEMLKMRHEFSPMPVETAYVPQGTQIPVFDERIVTSVIIAGAGIALGYAAMAEAAGGGMIYLMR